MRLDQLNTSEEKFSNIVEGCESSLDNLQSYVESEVQNVKAKFDLEVVKLSNRFTAEINKVKKQLNKAERYSKQLEQALDSYKRSLERETRAENKKLKEKIVELEKFISSIEFIDDDVEKKELEADLKEKEEKEKQHFLRARTFAFFQKILMMIGKWSDDILPAEDFEIVSRSILIPSVYMRISKYEPNYLLESLPQCKEIVINGREYISALRKEYPTNLASRSVWDSATEEIKIWWTDYALPEIFGWRDERWDHDQHLDWEISNKWENNPTDQMTLFPPVYDTMYSMRCYDSLTSPMRELALELEDKKYKFPSNL
jgi:hypothetical protein